MKNIESIFAPLLYQIAWSVKKGHGSFVTMEFGEPHLQVREPKTSQPADANVIKSMARRRVFISGKWHLWIEHASWNASVSGKTCTDSDTAEKMNEVFSLLDGQMLSKANYDPAKKSLILKFDLGANIELSPADYDASEVWSLTDHGAGSIMIFHKNGNVTTAESSVYKPGSINIRSKSD